MDTFKNFIEYASLIISVILILKLLNSQFKIYQQSHYSLSSFYKNLKFFYLSDRTNFLYPLILLVFFLDKWYIQCLYFVYLGILIYLKLIRKDIVSLKITARIRRLYLSFLIVSILFGTILHWLVPLPQLISGIAIEILFSPFLVYLTAIFMLPLEELISRYFQHKAKRKLKAFHTEIIGITGSYGKTSTKMILYSFLKEKYIVLATEKSFNTQNGVSKSINNQLTKHHQMMIAEMGATRTNDIRKLVKLTAPKYGIVTDIGPQHLKSFKSIDNIVKEKMSLIDSLPEDGIGVINADNPLIKNYKIRSKCKIVTFGTGKDCDYQAKEIRITLKGIEFTILRKNQQYQVKCPLLGKHNAINILAAFAMAMELKVDAKDIVFQISQQEQVKNRLSIQELHGLTIIEDAFNSNSIGFRSALEVLALFDKTKILITPGIVDAGVEEETLNYQMADSIARVCDYVILVNTKSSSYIRKGLEDCDFKNVITVDTYFKAIKIAEGHQNAVVLIENDVTDIYQI